MDRVGHAVEVQDFERARSDFRQVLQDESWPCSPLSILGHALNFLNSNLQKVSRGSRGVANHFRPRQKPEPLAAIAFFQPWLWGVMGSLIGLIALIFCIQISILFANPKWASFGS